MSHAYSYGQGGGGGYGSGGYGGPPGGGAPGGGGYGGPPGGGAGGYPPQQQRPQVFNKQTGAPPGANPQLWGWFVAVDRDGSGNITPVELQQALVNGDWSPFDLDTVKMLMAIFDVDRSGHITFKEFEGLWRYVQDWQGVFRHFDQDRSGSIDQSELQNALRNFGYNLNPRLLQMLVAKYINPETASGSAGSLQPAPGRGGAPSITFDTLTESFQRFDHQRTGWAQISYDQFMDACLSAP
ncbi:hypothetical protein OC834_004745 [Tilletia horrida]|uniref:EF-hand domain-containing protein n=1 Tax=Tilletia horrida TaxID=155126 RepID=A0AAN6GHJ7_9BASI|nr:hypothetical protein OC834_004745 [Tilletia horrida]KAK0530868.1 hypothetical protein OC835_003867 [Tilletia horrida]KAK0541160.1 hypothetical protein OC842_000119 [Tilletia horrida]